MITIRTHGLAEVMRHLQAMRERAQDASPAWQEFLRWWADNNAEHFSSRGKRWRTPWEPLAPSTRAEKARLGYLSDPLLRTSALRRDLVRRPLGFEHIRPDEVEAGTRIDYARFHQRGTRRMPARPLVNARAVGREGAAGSAILSWIMDGESNIGGGTKLER